MINTSRIKAQLARALLSIEASIAVLSESRLDSSRLARQILVLNFNLSTHLPKFLAIELRSRSPAAWQKLGFVSLAVPKSRLASAPLLVPGHVCGASTFDHLRGHTAREDIYRYHRPARKDSDGSASQIASLLLTVLDNSNPLWIAHTQALQLVVDFMTSSSNVQSILVFRTNLAARVPPWLSR